MRARSRPSCSTPSGERLRKAGAEFGTTTGRPRRCGWFDAPIARYAARINGVTDFVLTKLDVLTGLDEVPVCVAYEIDGKRVDEVPMNQAEFARAVPIYETFPGWTEDISAARTLADLPRNARDYVAALEQMITAPISVIGVGPGPRRDGGRPRPARLTAFGAPAAIVLLARQKRWVTSGSSGSRRRMLPIPARAAVRSAPSLHPITSAGASAMCSAR